MDMRVPDFDRDEGLAVTAADADVQASDDESREQEAAFERLVDRVTAARSIV